MICNCLILNIDRIIIYNKIRIFWVTLQYTFISKLENGFFSPKPIDKIEKNKEKCKFYLTIQGWLYSRFIGNGLMFSFTQFPF